MRGHPGGGGHGAFLLAHGLWQLLMLALVVAVAFFVVKKLRAKGALGGPGPRGAKPGFGWFAPTGPAAPADPAQSALVILNERLAKGDIEIDDYHARLSALKGHDPSPSI